MTEPTTPHRLSYLAFIRRMLYISTEGRLSFYAWMTLLTAIILVGANAWAHQTVHGMGLTGMSDHVSWGLYIANFTFVVGLAAGAVTMVIPAYLYHDREMHDVVIVGEILAVAAIVMALAFVNADLGRPDRFWHMLPWIGRFHWPVSMLSWDVIALGGYLLLNLHVVGYLLYMRFLGRLPEKKWYVPIVMVSIFWAVSIHTVTAFLYSGLGGRPFWNTALLAPRFIASAFVSGPAFVFITLRLLRALSGFHVGDGALRTLLRILRVAVLLNLFMLGSELFTEFYSGGAHTASARYLWLGLHGHHGLVPWIRSALAMELVGVVLVMSGDERYHLNRLSLGCVLLFAGVWIEKGMGLIIPGFIPSTLHEIVEYAPSLIEWRVTAGIWALGLLVFTLGLRIASAVLTEENIGGQ